MSSSAQVVLDGGGKVTLSGHGRRRILYLDSCDPKQVFVTSHCQDQATPRLTVQGITLTGGNSAASPTTRVATAPRGAASASRSIADQARAVNVQGIRLTPWMKPLRNRSGSPAAMSGNTRSSSLKMAWSCVRASEAPRQ
jgi:hypothetical protein